MLQEFTINSFRPHVGSAFNVAVGHAKHIEFILESVDSLTEKVGMPAGDREPFSMVFAGPGDLLLQQQIVPMHHPSLGQLEIFVVPIGRGGDGHFQYQAIFT